MVNWKINILSGIFNLKKDTNIINAKYIPPATAINSWIANESGETFISLVSFIWRKYRNRCNTEMFSIMNNANKSIQEYMITPPKTFYLMIMRKKTIYVTKIA